MEKKKKTSERERWRWQRWLAGVGYDVPLTYFMYVVVDMM